METSVFNRTETIALYKFLKLNKGNIETFLKIQCIAKVLNCLYWFNLIDDLNWSETCKYIFSVPCRFSHLSKYFMFKSLFCSYQTLVSFSVYVCSSLINTLMPNAPK